MAKYLRPKRGSKDIAHTQNFVLRPGELFMEFPEGMIGKEPGRIVIGDGATSYDHIEYATTTTNKFQPFITDPSIYVPRFENSNPQTNNYTFDAGTTEINNIGNGSTAGAKLPKIIGSIKGALVKHANSLNYLYQNKLSINGGTAGTIYNNTDLVMAPTVDNRGYIGLADRRYKTIYASTFDGYFNGTVTNASSAEYSSTAGTSSFASWASDGTKLGKSWTSVPNSAYNYTNTPADDAPWKTVITGNAALKTANEVMVQFTNNRINPIVLNIEDVTVYTTFLTAADSYRLCVGALWNKTDGSVSIKCTVNTWGYTDVPVKVDANKVFYR
jgi:hypothetical protein